MKEVDDYLPQTPRKNVEIIQNLPSKFKYDSNGMETVVARESAFGKKKGLDFF